MRYLTILTASLFIGLLMANVLSAQNEEDRFLPYGGYKVMGFNTTPLLVQLIPFNRSDPRVTGPYFVNWRSYLQKNDKLKGFKISFGVDFSDTDDASPVQAFFNVRLGFESYRRISPRWGYTRGFSGYYSTGDFNTPGTKPNDDVFLGGGPHWGVDFFLAPKVSLSLETALVLGMTGVGGKFEFIPPVSLTLNFWSPKQERQVISNE